MRSIAIWVALVIASFMVGAMGQVPPRESLVPPDGDIVEICELCSDVIRDRLNGKSRLRKGPVEVGRGPGLVESRAFREKRRHHRIHGRRRENQMSVAFRCLNADRAREGGSRSALIFDDGEGRAGGALSLRPLFRGR